MSSIPLQILGNKYGRLTPISKVKSRKDGRLVYLCECDCGQKTEVKGTLLNKGVTKSCGCLWKEAISCEPEVASFNALYLEYSIGAKRRNLEFSLTKEQFRNITSSNCFYCNIEPKQQARRKGRNNGLYTHNGIDRKNNNGYILDNCVACCKICNIAKATLIESDFYIWISRCFTNLNNKGLI